MTSRTIVLAEATQSEGTNKKTRQERVNVRMWNKKGTKNHNFFSASKLFARCFIHFFSVCSCFFAAMACNNKSILIRSMTDMRNQSVFVESFALNFWGINKKKSIPKQKGGKRKTLTFFAQSVRTSELFGLHGSVWFECCFVRWRAIYCKTMDTFPCTRQTTQILQKDRLSVLRYPNRSQNISSRLNFNLSLLNISILQRSECA